MSRRAYGIVTALLVLSVIDIHAAVDTAGVPWVPLFNGRDFTGWDFTVNYGPTVMSTCPLAAVDSGMLHVYPPGSDMTIWAGMRTLKEYSRFDVRMNYKWGPRNKGKVLSGFFVRVPKDDYQIWPTHMQFEINSDTTPGASNPTGACIAWSIQVTPDYNGLHPSKEQPGWNCIGTRVLGGDEGFFLLNGFRTYGWTRVSMATGKLWLELEGGEVLFRNVEIRNYDTAFAPITILKTGTQIAASNRDNYMGTVKTVTGTDGGGGQMVTSQGADDWITFYRMDFGTVSPAKFFARCSGSGTIHVLVDGPMDAAGTGKEIASVSAQSGFATVESPLKSTTGVHQLYLRLDKGVSLNWFQFGGSVGVAPRGAGQNLQARGAAAEGARLISDLRGRRMAAGAGSRGAQVFVHSDAAGRMLRMVQR